jgi:acetyl-CoA acetyltransferase
VDSIPLVDYLMLDDGPHLVANECTRCQARYFDRRSGCAKCADKTCQVLPDVNTLTRQAAATAYEQAGIGPEDLDLVELHDCFATAELVHYDNLQLCEPGGAVDFFKSGAPWRDGRLPVNVSGGLQSKGHPVSATGIANIWEIATHLRGEAGDRQIPGAKVGLAHVIGLGSACCVHVLEKSAL